MNNDETIKEAVRRAQKIAQKNGFEPGQAVAHPSDPYIYEFIRKSGSVAIVGLSTKKSPTKKQIEKEFPLAELFDPNVAVDLALVVRDEEHARLLPWVVVVRLRR